MALMGKLIDARKAAELAGISRSQINRDAAAGILPTAIQFPGYNGPRLFEVDDVQKTYSKSDDARVAS